VIVNYDKGALNITAREDFPSYTLKNFKLFLSSGSKILKEYPLPVLNPGESTTIKMAKPFVTTMISVTNSKGFKVFESGLKQ
jgi:hypothetical protein